MYYFGRESRRNLEGVHPELVIVAEAAIKRIDFKVIEGIRHIDRQRELVKEGKSWTMDSMHLVQPHDGYAHAIDFIPHPFKGWEDILSFAHVIMVFGEEAARLGVRLEFGGNWSKKDYPHIQLSR